jgi:DNA-binding NtrC family response regulator
MKWQGNIRELENVAQYLINVGNQELVVSDLPLKYRDPVNDKAEPETRNASASREYVDELIIKMYQEEKIGRRKIREKMLSRGLKVSEYHIRGVIEELENSLKRDEK